MNFKTSGGHRDSWGGGLSRVHLTSGDIMSTSGDVHYIGGISCFMWGDIMNTLGGGFAVHWRDFKST